MESSKEKDELPITLRNVTLYMFAINGKYDFEWIIKWLKLRNWNLDWTDDYTLWLQSLNIE